MSEGGASTPRVDVTEQRLASRAAARLEESRKDYEQEAQRQLAVMSEQLTTSVSEAAQRWKLLLSAELSTTATGIRNDLRQVRAESGRIHDWQIRRAKQQAKRWTWTGASAAAALILIGAGIGLWVRFTVPTVSPAASVPTTTIIQGGSTYETISEKGWTVCKNNRPCKKVKD